MLKQMIMESPSEIPDSSFNTDFCLQFAYKVLLKQVEKGTNFVSSPLSLHIILSLVAAGSTGKTLEQLLLFLGSKHIDDLNSLSSNVVSRIRQIEGIESGGPIVSFVNGVWVEKSFGLKPSFEEIVKHAYQSQIEAVDFVNKGDQVRDEVNLWVENATNGLIRELLPSGSLHQLTRQVFVNALFFKGGWGQSFDPSRTKTRSFNLLNGEVVPVPFMTLFRDKPYYYNYRSFEDVKILEIPYKSGNKPMKFAMYFFLPHENNGLPNLIHTLNSNPRFLNQDFGLRKEKIAEFWIPRFKFSFNLEASESMQDLGLTSPFNPGELREVSDSSILGHDPLVPKIFHKASIEVNEEGTKAAVSTGLSRAVTSARGQIPASFVADHPFVFMIREEASMAVFFVGAVLNPLLAS